MQSGLSQKSTVLKTPTYELISNNNDTLILITVTKQELALLRLYITELEFIRDTSFILTQKVELKDKQILLLKKENSNLKEILLFNKKSINLLSQKLIDIEKAHKKELRKENRKNFVKGFVYGAVGGFLGCLLLI